MASRHRIAAVAAATTGLLALAACSSSVEGTVVDSAPTAAQSSTTTAAVSPGVDADADGHGPDETGGFDLGLPPGMDPEIVEVIAPVGPDGQVAPGWTISDEEPVTDVDCYAPASTAVTGGVYQCGPSAVYLPACWPTEQDRTMLCVRATEDRELFRVVASGTDHYEQVADPMPLTLELADGAECLIRIGGAWGANRTAPDSLPTYACDVPAGSDADPKMVWIGDVDEDQFDSSSGVTTVLYGDYDEELTPIEVVRAVFAGTQG